MFTFEENGQNFKNKIRINKIEVAVVVNIAGWNTEQMKKESAARMDNFIKGILHKYNL